MRPEQGASAATAQPQDVRFYRSPVPMSSTDRETRAIENDAGFYARLLSRLNRAARSIDAEAVLGPLDSPER
jgi:hypothetical protein